MLLCWIFKTVKVVEKTKNLTIQVDVIIIDWEIEWLAKIYLSIRDIILLNKAVIGHRIASIN